MTLVAERTFTDNEIESATSDIVAEWIAARSAEFNGHILLQERQDGDMEFTIRITSLDPPS